MHVLFVFATSLRVRFLQHWHASYSLEQRELPQELSRSPLTYLVLLADYEIRIA